MWFAGALFVLVIIVFLQIRFHLFYNENVLRIGLVGTYQQHDLPDDVTRLVSTGLVKADSQGRIKPNLVTGWEVNNDATAFKFKLKNNLKWSDNTPVKAKDLVIDIPNTNISFPDDKTIKITLKESYSPLPSLLSKPVFKRGSMVGIGPYKITGIEKSRIFIKKITLEGIKPGLPSIQARFYPNEKVAITGFNLGEVQVLAGMGTVRSLSASPLVKVSQKTDFSKIVTVLYQTTDSLLGNRSLRQALSYQAPKIKNEETADNPYPPFFWAYNPDSKKYLSNPEEAEAALGRAKSSLSEAQLSSQILLTTTPNLESVGRELVKAWKKLGFDVKLRVESGIPQNFQALLITQSIPADPDQYFLWHATQTKTNLTSYDSKRVDKDLEDGRKIITEDDRKTKYYDFQKSLLEDAPATFLYFPKTNIIYLKKVEKLLDTVLNLSR